MRDGVESDSETWDSVYVPSFDNYKIEYPLQLLESDNNRDIKIKVKVTQGERLLDSVEFSSKVIPNGFEQYSTFSDVLSKSASTDEGSSVSKSVVIPDTILGKPEMTLKLFSTTFDSILDAIKSLIRDPYGCFEQTSSTTYPMVMALQLL